MSLLRELKNKKQEVTSHRDNIYMHVAVFDSALYRIGIDNETIELHKKEPPETWEETLKKYEQHGN